MWSFSHVVAALLRLLLRRWSRCAACVCPCVYRLAAVFYGHVISPELEPLMASPVFDLTFKEQYKKKKNLLNYLWNTVEIPDWPTGFPQVSNVDDRTCANRKRISLIRTRCGTTWESIHMVPASAACQCRLFLALFMKYALAEKDPEPALIILQWSDGIICRGKRHPQRTLCLFCLFIVYLF